MEYLKCNVCREAYFRTEEARARHQPLCTAVHLATSRKRKSEPEKQKQAKRSKTRTPKASAASIAAAVDSFNAPTTSRQLQWVLKKGLSSAKDYIINNTHYKDLAPFLDAAKPLLAEILGQETERALTTSFKYSLVAEALYEHPEGMQDIFNFKTSAKTLHSAEDVADVLHDAMEKLLREESEAENKGSGWSLLHPTTLTLRINRYSLVKPPGNGIVKLPKKLTDRKSLVHVRNTDGKCFMYCLLAKHLPQIPDHLDERTFADTDRPYNFEGLRFPLPVTQVKMFERRNPGCSVNVFEAGSDCVITPLKVVSQELDDHTDLLLYRSGNNSHYVLITDFAKLLKPQVARGRNEITVCKRCYTYKENRRCVPDPATWLAEHESLCMGHKPCNVKMPKDSRLTFTNYESQIPVPIVVTADFEATLRPTVSTNNAYQVHEPNSFCVLVKSTFPASVLDEAGISTVPFLKRSVQNVGEEFLLYMKELAKRVETLYTSQVPLAAMTDAECERHRTTTQCDLCDVFFDERQEKVLDHCHVTGKYRHTLCNRCNLRCSMPNFIPVYFHNFRNYDQAFIVKSLAVLEGNEVKVIPSNTERFTSISVRVGRMWIRFLDSYRLMAESLASLANALVPEDLVESAKLVGPDQFYLVRRKGCYPYDYVTSHSVFNETSLPTREKFYNRLNEEPVSVEDYEHAQDVWNTLQMRTFGDYHDFYLRLDVCLLMDVLMSFRQTCLKAYRIDCCHQYTAPGLAFSAMLRMTKITLELITDADQMLMIESAIRGGLVQCCLRHVQANNPLLENPTDYDPSKEKSHLQYLDCVNLYGYCMSLPLPYGDFRWEDSAPGDWSTLPTDSTYGYILECDVQVPESVHDAMQDMPLLPELAVPPGGKCAKLLATLHNKTRYVAHYTVFQQAVRLGLKVTKIHRALRFSQSPWMKKFIDYNAAQRAKATDAFSKSFYKLLNNSAFGKTIENVRKRINVHLVTTDAKLQKLVRQPNFVEHNIVADGVVVVHMRKRSVTLDKPIYVGMTVLDVSKVHMYNFHYSVMRPHFSEPGETIEVAYIDTDGLVYHIRTNRDLYSVFGQPSLAQHLDRSVYPDEHPLKDDTNKGRIGTFKDECKGRAMFEYVGLRPKMYTHRFSSSSVDGTRKAKGIKSGYVSRNLRFLDYKRTLFEKKPPDAARFNVISSRSFRLMSTCVVKKSLSAEDDKRQVLGIRTLPYGHYKLNTVEDGATMTHDDD